jgi:hypothetical protein
VAGRLRKGASDGSGGFFDERGNRNRGGEYIIWLRPDFTAEGELRVLPRAELTIFKGAATGEGNEWDLIRTVEINYGNDPRPR